MQVEKLKTIDADTLLSTPIGKNRHSRHYRHFLRKWI